MAYFLLGWLIAVNLVSFFAFGWDKRAARRGARRVPEAKLLLFSLPLGAIGAWLGVKVFRHKTVKTSFRVKLFAVTFLQLLAVAAVLYWRYGPES